MVPAGIEPLRAEAATPVSSELWVFTCAGVCFGFRIGHSLFLYEGTEIGRFVSEDVFSVEGKYLGEIRRTEDGNRLMVSRYKSARTAPGFTPGRTKASDRPSSRQGLAPYCGYDDFPSPETFRDRIQKKDRPEKPALRLVAPPKKQPKTLNLPAISEPKRAPQSQSGIVVDSGLIDRLSR